ncbi:MAG: hypothetical protein PHR30_16470 [Gallionellaceae bacterium]|nr:hypothetical protein [Gallionellaceae bacterium]
MSAICGKRAVLYLAAATSEAAINIGEQTEYSIELEQGLEEVSALGSTWGVHVVSGARKWTAGFRGNFDTASNQLWNAAICDQPLRFYLYPSSLSVTLYYYGTGWVKLGTVIAGGMTSAPKNAVTITGEGELAKN